MPGYVLSKNDYTGKWDPKNFRKFRTVQLPPSHYRIEIGIGDGIEPLEFAELLKKFSHSDSSYRLKKLGVRCIINVKPESTELVEIEGVINYFQLKRDIQLSKDLSHYKPGDELPKELTFELLGYIHSEIVKHQKDLSTREFIRSYEAPLQQGN